MKQNIEFVISAESSDSALIKTMNAGGLALKQCVLDKVVDTRRANEQIVGSEDEDDPEVKFLKSLTPKQKKKLLK